MTWLFDRLSTRAALAAFVLSIVSVHAWADKQTELPRLQISGHDSNGWVRLNLPGETNKVYTIFGSTSLSNWTAVAKTHHGVFNFPDFASPLFPARFYSVTAAAKGGQDDWANQARLPSDPFLSSSDVFLGSDLRWIKFAIPLQDSGQVYYQDSKKYTFHYDFATKRLRPFEGMTPTQFDQAALHTNQQQVLLGAVLLPSFPNEREFGIQFVGLDAYPAEFVARHYEMVKETVSRDSDLTPFYVPAYEQAASAEANRAYFQSKGIRVTSADRWVSGNNVYSEGWALGRLKFIRGSEIASAFTDGRLGPEDILLTDGVPAEIPVLAGVMTLTPSTPNSHVAILSKSFGLPFVYISEEAERQRVQALAGKDILLKVEPYSMEVRIVELDPEMDPAVRSEILNLKTPPVLHIVPKARYGKITASTDNLTPADIRYFGGKASNFGFLRREIPDRSPPAIAISFDLWDEFVNQVLPSGRTVRAEIETRLAPFSYPPNVAAVKAALAEIRNLITKTASFTLAQKEAILGALEVFPRGHNIRFRSSTNCEDSEQFTGAGLYDSFSGCVDDDTDSDTAGPSHCDPTEDNERGVFRALQKVYASFYNDNAFIERLRYGVDEDSVGMAVLVHLSAPDNTELANGVATLVASRAGSFDTLDGDLVTQKGAVSVTNPDGAAKPEVVQGYENPSGAGGFLKQRSSLVPLGSYVMDWEADYVQLMNLFAKVADGYQEYFTSKPQFTLDFEYKKITPGVLEIKQVREVPVSQATNSLAAYLVNGANRLWVMQGEAGDVFSNHRLKSFWSLQTKNIKLTETNLTRSIFARVEGEYLSENRLKHLTGAPEALPDASHALENDTVIDRWIETEEGTSRKFELRAEVRRSVTPPQGPVFTLPDFRIGLNVQYATPQPVLRFDFDSGGLKQDSVTNHAVALEPRRVRTSTDPLQKRTASAGGISIETEFYWSIPSGFGIIQKTQPLAEWKETRIQGLTSEPIVLHGELSQTYRPGHHNFTEEFVFEPALEQGVTEKQIQELEAANVKFIYVQTGFEGDQIHMLGLDGKFRFLGKQR